MRYPGIVQTDGLCQPPASPTLVQLACESGQIAPGTCILFNGASLVHADFDEMLDGAYEVHADFVEMHAGFDEVHSDFVEVHADFDEVHADFDEVRAGFGEVLNAFAYEHACAHAYSLWQFSVETAGSFFLSTSEF